MSRFFIFSTLIFFTFQNDNIILIDKLFKKEIETKFLYMDHCKQYDKKTFYYKGRPHNMKDILESKKRKDLSKYKYVYIPEIKYFDNVTLFPKSTIFFVLDSLTTNGSYYKDYYCYFDINWNLNYYKPFYYLIAGKNFEEDRENVILIILTLFFFTCNIFVIILNIKICRLKPLEQIYLYQFPKILMSAANIIILSSLFIKYSFLSVFFYSLYKSYIFIHLIFYLDGFMTLEFNYSGISLFFKLFLLLFIFDSLITLFFLYIIYFIPSLNNFYLFAIKNWIMHLVLLLFTIKCIKTKFIPLYRQFRFEQSKRTFFILAYKIKIIIYLKVVIFSIIYSLIFIILPFAEIINSLDKYPIAFYLHYYINTICEIILCFILSILFFPVKISFLYYLPVFYDYNSRKFIAKISKENEKINNISNLINKQLKKYKDKDIPIVFINPFSDNNSFQKLYIGKVENSKKLNA